MTASDPKVVQLFYFDAGGGHRSAATALRDVMAERFPHWRVELVNLQELLQDVDPIARFAKKIHPKKEFRCEDVYNKLIKHGWTLGSEAMLRGLQKGIQLYAPFVEEPLRRHWQNSHPDLVVSMIPNFNDVMYRSLRDVHPDVPYTTIVTDMADYPPHFWMEQQEQYDRQDQYMICGSKRAVRQAKSAGYGTDRIFQVSGMIMKPAFYAEEEIDRGAEREALGLRPNRTTVLIMFGGNGSKASTKIIDRLERSDIKLQYIVMCGRNEKLRQELDELNKPGKRKLCYPVGFTDRVPYFMRLSDIGIGKPGPAFVTEASHTGLAVIVPRNKRTLPQERYNAKWVERHKVGLVVKSFRRTPEAIRALLRDDTLKQFRHNALSIDNRAVFEIPYLLEQIMNGDGVEPKLDRTFRPNVGGLSMVAI